MALSAASVPSFAGPRHYATGQLSVSVAIGDLNRDGTPDIATANSLPGTVSVLLNRGDGSFSARRNYATAQTPESVVSGHLNGDGTPDIATANSSAATALLDSGSGTLP